MSGILSAISGQFSRALILGAFLPTAVFVILSLVFLVPLLPTEWPVLAPLIALDPQWKVIVLTLVTIVLSDVLYNVNIPIIRLYEGYPWKNSSGEVANAAPVGTLYFCALTLGGDAHSAHQADADRSAL